jgi:hypothetical protein
VGLIVNVSEPPVNTFNTYQLELISSLKLQPYKVEVVNSCVPQRFAAPPYDPPEHNICAVEQFVCAGFGAGLFTWIEYDPVDAGQKKLLF